MAKMLAVFAAIGAAAFIGALIIFQISQGAWSSGDANKGNREVHSDPRQLACFAAQLAVKQKLARPGDAIFALGACQGATGISDDGPNRYLARGVFETPDSSGIMRQHGYAVSVEHMATGYRTNVMHID